MVIVEDERVESLVRALLECFDASGGVPLRVVFDRPKTVVVGKDEHGQPIWNATLAQMAIDYGFTIELCAPRSPEQKGSVENLVGFVKRSFFRARRFADVDTDVNLDDFVVLFSPTPGSGALREGVSPVPEPGTWALLGVGLLVVALTRRGRTRRRPRWRRRAACPE